MDYNFPRLVVRRMLSFPGINRRRNRRHLKNLQERRTAQQTVLQVNQVVFPDGSSVAGAGGNLDTEATTNTESNDYQFLVTDRGITEALEDITAESVTVNQDIIPNVNQPADNSANVVLESDQLPNLTAWHNVTPLNSELPDQETGSFVYAKSATPFINDATFYGNDYLQIEEPGVYEIEADMYWVSDVSVGIEKTIATQLYISRTSAQTATSTEHHEHTDYSGIGPVSTCFMFGNVRMGSTSVSTVTQCAAGDRVRVMAVGTLAERVSAPVVTSPAGRSSLRVRRISNHFNGHLSYSTSFDALDDSGAGEDRTIKVYRGLPEGVPLGNYVTNPVIDYTMTLASDTAGVAGATSAINIAGAPTWLSGARDYYIQVDPPIRILSGTITLTQVSLNTPTSSIFLWQETLAGNGSRNRTEMNNGSKYVELLSGTFDNGLIRFKCALGLNLNDLKAGVITTISPETRPDYWLEFNFS